MEKQLAVNLTAAAVCMYIQYVLCIYTEITNIPKVQREWMDRQGRGTKTKQKQQQQQLLAYKNHFKTVWAKNKVEEYERTAMEMGRERETQKSKAYFS